MKASQRSEKCKPRKDGYFLAKRLELICSSASSCFRLKYPKYFFLQCGVKCLQWLWQLQPSVGPDGHESTDVTPRPIATPPYELVYRACPDAKTFQGLSRQVGLKTHHALANLCSSHMLGFRPTTLWMWLTLRLELNQLARAMFIRLVVSSYLFIPMKVLCAFMSVQE